jgi:peptidoglycan/xylan/chitin deacetylase (PgdA/CDA1 family)
VLPLALWVLAVAGQMPANVATVPAPGPYFALTFDAHERTEGAKELLALLRERGVRATLFVTGTFAARHPEILRLAAAAGHEIGNHTYHHPHLTTWATNGRHDTLPTMTRERLQEELTRTAEAITAAIGRPPAPLWRAPYGEHNAEIRGWAAELGLLHVDWTRAGRASLDALDWVEDPQARNYLSAEAMARRLLHFEERTGVPLAGSIVLMHLGSGRTTPPLLEALPIFLDETDRRGLRPLPVGELLRRASTASAAGR